MEKWFWRSKVGVMKVVVLAKPNNHHNKKFLGNAIFQFSKMHCNNNWCNLLWIMVWMLLLVLPSAPQSSTDHPSLNAPRSYTRMAFRLRKFMKCTIRSMIGGYRIGTFWQPGHGRICWLMMSIFGYSTTFIYCQMAAFSADLSTIVVWLIMRIGMRIRTSSNGTSSTMSATYIQMCVILLCILTRIVGRWYRIRTLSDALLGKSITFYWFLVILHRYWPQSVLRK